MEPKRWIVLGIFGAGDPTMAPGAPRAAVAAARAAVPGGPAEAGNSGRPGPGDAARGSSPFCRYIVIDEPTAMTIQSKP